MNGRKLLAALTACVLAMAADGAEIRLPQKLTLNYVLTYGGIKVGEVTKTLSQEQAGLYTHETWTRPAGIAGTLTSTEFLETGRFLVDRSRVVPQTYKEERRGDKKSHNHTVNFDWGRRQIIFENGRTQKLPRGSQDQGSIFYLFMLQPLLSGERVVYISDGDELERYTFTYVGRERLTTPFGVSDTVVLQRISDKQREREKKCREEGQPNGRCITEEFQIWLAPEKNYVPVKLKKRKKGQTLILTLDGYDGTG